MDSLLDIKIQKIRLLKVNASKLLNTIYTPAMQDNASLGIEDGTNTIEEINSFVANVKIKVIEKEKEINDKNTLDDINQVNLEITL